MWSDVDVFCCSTSKTMYDILCGMVWRYCTLGVMDKHDDCRLRHMAREVGRIDGSSHSMLTADVQV